MECFKHSSTLPLPTWTSGTHTVYPRMLFNDNSSAFNTSVRYKLIIRLLDLGLNRTLCRWILDFLTYADGHTSSTLPHFPPPPQQPQSQPQRHKGTGTGTRHPPATDDQAVPLRGSHRCRCMNVWLWSNNCKVLWVSTGLKAVYINAVQFHYFNFTLYSLIILYN